MLKCKLSIRKKITQSKRKLVRLKTNENQKDNGTKSSLCKINVIDKPLGKLIREWKREREKKEEEEKRRMKRRKERRSRRQRRKEGGTGERGERREREEGRRIKTEGQITHTVNKRGTITVDPIGSKRICQQFQQFRWKQQIPPKIYSIKAHSRIKQITWRALNLLNKIEFVV